MNDPHLNKYFRYLLILIIFLLTFASGYLLGKVNVIRNDLSDKKNQYLYGDFSGDGVGVNVDILWEAWRKLEENYIESDFDRQEMLYGAIEGLVASLDDPYTQFLSPKETSDYLESSGGKFEGIGAFLRYNGEYTIVDTPIDDFPAQKAGLMPGDVILEVDGQDVSGKGSYEVAELIKGPKGTSVNIKIFRPKDQEELSFDITRDSIDIDNVKLVEIKDGVGHIKMYKFNETNSQEFKNQWDGIVSEIVASGAHGVILDLRNNPGGLVELVKYVSEEFLSTGDLIMMEEEKNGVRREFKATRDGRLKDKKIVVLVNEGSASASEILAGALQDNDAATIIGMPTVGKGVEQTVVTLSDNSTMHIVFRRWLKPSGDQVSPDSPIQPDIEVDLTTEDFEQGLDPQMDRAWEEF